MSYKTKDIYTILGWVAMFAVPIAPAFFFGFEFASDVHGLVSGATESAWLPGLFALVVGLVSAAGLELVGILSGHNAIRAFDMERYGWASACAIILVSYVALGIVGLEAVLAKGVVMFLVAPLVYVLVGIQHRLEAMEKGQASREQKRQERAWSVEDREAAREHEARLREAEMRHKEKLARIEAKKFAQAPAQAKARANGATAERPQSEYKCEGCGSVFGSQNALNAHGRWCEPEAVQVSTNGAGK